LAYMPGEYLSDSVLGALEGKYDEKKMRAKMEDMELDYERQIGGIRSNFGSVEGYRDYIIEDYARPKFKTLKNYISGLKFDALSRYMGNNNMKPLGKILPKKYVFGLPLRIFGHPYHV